MFIILTKNDIHDNIKQILNAAVAELADAPDLGSGIFDVQVQALSGAPIKRLVFQAALFILHPIHYYPT